MKFTKMHGAGNDFIYVNCFKEKVKNPAKLARIVSDRHTGIGGDGLILICPSKKADVRMRIFNADGSEAEMCGNGIRCVAKYVYEHKLARPKEKFVVEGQPAFAANLSIETGRGVLTVGLSINKKGKVQKACVNMGQPILSPKKIPVNPPQKRRTSIEKQVVVNEPITILGQELLMTCVSMGNPHAVFFCDDVSIIELEKLGPAIEKHELFPERTNVHFVQVDNSAFAKATADKKNEFTMRTWERGSGETLACGTGACACCVAAVVTNQVNRKCTAHLPGGDLDLFWSEEDNCVYMTGPAVEVFSGVFNLK
jgi:diaminopimelate epimerase